MEKLQLYQIGCCTFKAPNVCTSLCLKKTEVNWKEVPHFSFQNAIIVNSQWVGMLFLLHCVTFSVLENIPLANHKCFRFIIKKNKNGKGKKIHTHTHQV